ncbi:glycosyltransferase [Flavobacterium urocaniciphilum]|uniref:Glycosyltransferase involved in cell wall bisynthesis n=1 Tax=Flavobacterium urocaniciphilum TaxID=1299341 RepID=A0A1H8YSF3_9FLAO|nr:glycosyltransferase [Flavobacterium urocaniciphilum]SEP54951.1 Glycosyltransferase involved in cell wall bisynthesis [Flavobacterium urocaniciphilum]
MRIIQLIDSLDAGGAERMAVNFANAISEKITFSGIVSTRKEGVLKQEIKQIKNYAFLGRKNKFDINAIFLASKYIKKNKIKIVHAHSSSYFFGVLIKIFNPKIQLIWHDHYGNRAKDNKQKWILKFCSFFFSKIFTVNDELRVWSLQHLNCKNVFFLPNFSDLKKTEERTILKGEAKKRIVCLANLKNPKNHSTLINGFITSEIYKQNWTLHLIGKDFKDTYSDNLKTIIKENGLENSIFIYNACQDIKYVLSQATIGVLASTYEGFPVTLLEYAQSKLTVLSTNVGFCSSLVTHNSNGLLFDPTNSEELSNHFIYLSNNPEICANFAIQFQKIVENNYSKEAIINKYLNLIN